MIDPTPQPDWDSQCEPEEQFIPTQHQGKWMLAGKELLKIVIPQTEALRRHGKHGSGTD